MKKFSKLKKKFIFENFFWKFLKIHYIFFIICWCMLNFLFMETFRSALHDDPSDRGVHGIRRDSHQRRGGLQRVRRGRASTPDRPALPHTSRSRTPCRPRVWLSESPQPRQQQHRWLCRRHSRRPCQGVQRPGFGAQQRRRVALQRRGISRRAVAAGDAGARRAETLRALHAGWGAEQCLDTGPGKAAEGRGRRAGRGTGSDAAGALAGTITYALSAEGGPAAVVWLHAVQSASLYHVCLCRDAVDGVVHDHLFGAAVACRRSRADAEGWGQIYRRHRRRGYLCVSRNP